jgi:hypothetical protein
VNHLEMNQVWEYFDEADADGKKPMAVCKLCKRRMWANTGAMSMHYRMSHAGKPAAQTGSGNIVNASAGRTGTAPARSEGELEQWHQASSWINGPESHNSGRSAVQKQDLMRAKSTVKHLAACSDPIMYAGIIKHAPPVVLRTIQNISEEALTAAEEQITPSEGAILHRYRKQLRSIADDTNDGESLRRKLLEPPAKRLRRAPESMNYIPAAILLKADNGYGWMDDNVPISSDDELEASSVYSGSSGARDGSAFSDEASRHDGESDLDTTSSATSDSDSDESGSASASSAGDKESDEDTASSVTNDSSGSISSESHADTTRSTCSDKGSSDTDDSDDSSEGRSDQDTDDGSSEGGASSDADNSDGSSEVRSDRDRSTSACSSDCDESSDNGDLDDDEDSSDWRKNVMPPAIPNPTSLKEQLLQHYRRRAGVGQVHQSVTRVDNRSSHSRRDDEQPIGRAVI